MCEDPESHFRYNFLHVKDRLISWTTRPTRDGIQRAEVLIELGQPKFPPKKLTRGLWYGHIKATSTIVDDVKGVMRIMEVGKETFSPEEQASYQIFFAAAESILKNHEASERVIMKELARPFEYVYDHAGMLCTVEFGIKYCRLCETTKHTLETCPNLRKECSFCRCSGHNVEICPKVCKCAYEHHTKNSPECPMTPKVRTKSEGEWQTIAKRRNTERPFPITHLCSNLRPGPYNAF